MTSVRDVLKAQIGVALHFYLCDLKASSAELLASKPGGAHRSPADFSYESALLTKMMAMRLRGEEPPAMDPSQGYPTAPENCRTSEALAAEMQAAIGEVMAALDNLDDEGLNATFEMWGRTWTKREMGSLVAMHLMYHDGQLNYVQTAHGDLAVHWAD